MNMFGIKVFQAMLYTGVLWAAKVFKYLYTKIQQNVFRSERLVFLVYPPVRTS